METVTFKLSSEFKDKADRLFIEQKERIQVLIPDADIEHIGGTAIPGLLTKGDLDINVRVTNKGKFVEAVDILKSLYEINQPNNWSHMFASFKDDTSFELPFGVQLTIIDSSEDYFVKQKETLLNNSELVGSYNSLRVQYQNKDMEEYRNAKDSFLKANNLA